MIVCVCNNVSDSQIRCALATAETFEELKKQLNICNRCCMCQDEIEKILSSNNPNHTLGPCDPGAMRH